MDRKKRFVRQPSLPNAGAEQVAARFYAGTLARIDAVLGDEESRASFIRDAVEYLIAHRIDQTIKAAERRGRAAALKKGKN